MRACRESDIRARHFRRFRRYQPALNLSCDLQVTLHRDLVGQFQRKKQQKENRCLEIHVERGIFSNLKFDSGHHQHRERDQQQDAPGRRHLHQQGPEECLGNAEQAAESPLAFEPFGLFHVEAVARACIGGELRP